MKIEYPVQLVLELACAAQRVNDDYVKGPYPIYGDDENGGVKIICWKQSNKNLVKFSLGDIKSGEGLFKLSITEEDKEAAENLRKHFRKLTFNIHCRSN